MKENKPLIFINSAQTNNFKQSNQYVYDSRYNKSEEIKIKQPVAVEENREEERQPEINNKNEEIQEPKSTQENKIERVEEMNDKDLVEEEDKNEEIDDAKQSKLYNKMDLLYKRAKLGRYVYVQVETIEETVEGYFKELLDDAIILDFEDKEYKIPIGEIKDILILRV